MSLADSKHPVWYPYYGSWLLALIFEIVLFILSLTICRPLNHFGYTLLGIQIFWLLAFILLAALHGGTPVSEEHTPLLINTGQPDGHVGLSNAKYGSTAVEKSSSDGADLEFEAEDRKKEEERIKDIKKRLTANGNWFTYACEFSIFLPYVWPSKSTDRKLQFNFLGVMLCLACARALNVLIPYQLGVMINAMGASQDRFPLMAIGLYIAFLTASSNVGIPLIKSWLWLPVEQYAYKSIKTASYNHIMGLSCDFHDDKQSGELFYGPPHTTAQIKASTNVETQELLEKKLRSCMILLAAGLLWRTLIVRPTSGGGTLLSSSNTYNLNERHTLFITLLGPLKAWL